MEDTKKNASKNIVLKIHLLIYYHPLYKTGFHLWDFQLGHRGRVWLVNDYNQTSVVLCKWKCDPFEIKWEIIERIIERITLCPEGTNFKDMY